jgi:hypothetical protein
LSPSALTYKLQVSLTNSFDSLSILYEYLVSDTAVVVDSLSENTHYYWRVACSNQYGWSLWSITLRFKTLLTTFVEDGFDRVFSFKLNQNYPNPFNPTTKIKFTIPTVETRHASSLQMITLKVYDVLGNEITTLVNKELFAGEYEVEFTGHSDEGQNLPSSIYFYQLKSGSLFQTKKMILLK